MATGSELFDPEAARAYADVGRMQKNEATASHTIDRYPGGATAAVRATSLAPLFAEAARALADVLGIARPGVERTDHLFTLHARDAETLLLIWLSDLHARSVAEQRLLVDVTIDALSERELQASVRSAEVQEWRLELRGQALPDIHLERRPDGFTALVKLAA
jgi:SHS2 domain-containing protein